MRMNFGRMLQLIFVIGIMTFSSSLSCHAQIKFETLVIDLGELLQMQKKEVNVVLINNSSIDANIHGLRVDCACLVLPKTRAFVLTSKERRVVPLHVETGLLRGPHRKIMQAFFGPRGQKICRIEIKFTVVPDLTFETNVLQLGAVRPGQALRRQIRITGRLGAKPKISLAALPSGITGQLIDAKSLIKGAGAWWLELNITIPKSAKAGRFSQFVKLNIQDAQITELKLAILGDVETDLSIRPRIVDFGKVDQGQDAIVKAKIQSLSQTRFKITNAIENNMVFADFDAEKLAVEHVVEFQLPQGQRLGPIFGIVKLTTSHPDVPLLELRYRAMVVKGKK